MHPSASGGRSAVTSRFKRELRTEAHQSQRGGKQLGVGCRDEEPVGIELIERAAGLRSVTCDSEEGSARGGRRFEQPVDGAER
jgi:hypothetical protein